MIIKRACQLKSQMTLYCRNPVLIVSVPAFYLYSTSLGLPIKYVIISILEQAFLYRGLAWLTSLPCSRPSAQNGSEGPQNPFEASFCHPVLHPMFSLTCLVSSLQLQLVLRTLAIQPVLRSTCPNHIILLVRSTI